MSTRSFGSLFMVASCAGAALGCYLVSLRVASERAALEDVENRIVLTQRDVRVIQTEIGTRGRLSQLERWNAGAFALSAPSANQFLQGSFELAKLTQPAHKDTFQAPVVLASAPAPQAHPSPLERAETDDSGAPAAAAASGLLHQASLKTETREVPARATTDLPPAAAPKSAGKPATADRLAPVTSADKPGLAAAHMAAKTAPKPLPTAVPQAQKKSVDKPHVAAARPMTKSAELAKNDPLAPSPDKHSGKTKDSLASR